MDKMNINEPMFDFSRKRNMEGFGFPDVKNTESPDLGYLMHVIPNSVKRQNPDFYYKFLIENQMDPYFRMLYEKETKESTTNPMNQMNMMDPMIRNIMNAKNRYMMNPMNQNMMNPMNQNMINQMIQNQMSPMYPRIIVIFRKGDEENKSSYSIPCVLNEKVSDIIQEYKRISLDNDISNTFIFNGKELNLNITVAEAGLTNQANISVITTKKVEGE